MTTQDPFDPTTLPKNLEKDAPLMHIITQELSHMSNEQLLAYTNNLRTLRTSAQTQRATIKKPTKAKKTFNHLLTGY